MATPETEAQRIDFKKLIIVGVLNMAQSFPQQFTTTALPFLFRQQGLPLHMNWLIQLPNYPNSFRWLISIAVDNFGNERFGNRKSWILPCTLVGALAYSVVAFIPPTLSAVYLISGILLFKAVVMVAQDTAIDAYATEAMNDRERPTGTSIINWLAGVAGVAGSGAVGLVERFGWRSTMLAASSLLLVAVTPAMIRREPPPPEARRRRQVRGNRANILLTLLRPESLYILPFAFLWGFGAGFVGPMIGPFYYDNGLTTIEYGTLVPITSFVGSTLTAIATPLLVQRIGLRRTALIGVCFMPIEAAMFCMFALKSLPPLPVLIAMVSVMGFATALFSYPVTISRFRWASKAQAGTDYALQSSLAGFGVAAGASLTGFLAEEVGWVYFFPIASLVSLSAGVFYVGMFNRIERLVQEREEAELDPNSTHVSQVRLARVLRFLARMVQILSRLLEFFGFRERRNRS